MDGSRLDLVPKNSHGDSSVFLENGQWNLTKIPAVRHVTYYQCCPQPYPDVTFELHLMRKPLYYVLHLVVPSLLISCTSIGAYLSPPESGEKVTLTITILLASTVFLMIVGDIMPPASSSMPLIGKSIQAHLPMDK